jgi:aminopeptidase-like protein
MKSVSRWTRPTTSGDLERGSPAIAGMTISTRAWPGLEGDEDMESSEQVGAEIYDLIQQLFPICRSITGDGVRESLRRLQRVIPIEVREVPSGTPVFDWTVPNEWNVRDAWVKDASGTKVVDFQRSNLHVVSYSLPVNRQMSFQELRPHLFTIPEHPDWIPYRTSYYRETWGFCLSHNQLQRMTDGDYDVCIDSSLVPGHLTYGELLVPGEREEEFLISAHICHPSLCNDNLSGVSIAAHMARRMLDEQRSRRSYRFLFIPGTIGAITWLARNRDRLERVRGGLTLVCLGDSSHLTYKKSLSGNSEIDRAAAYALAHSGESSEIIDFFPYGYDERQFNSPGFRLPVGSLMRGRHGQFPEYHTSADNLEFVRPHQLAGSYHALRQLVEILEGNRTYQNLFPYGEPQLGKRGVYREMGDADQARQLAMLWALTLSDGRHSLLDIAERSGADFALVRDAAAVLVNCGVLKEAGMTPAS